MRRTGIETLLRTASRSSSEPPKLLIIPTLHTTKIHQVIYVGETEYKLIAAGILFDMKEFDSKHIVAGLLCGTKYYVYDSNNIISYSNWNQSIYNDYINYINTP